MCTDRLYLSVCTDRLYLCVLIGYILELLSLLYCGLCCGYCHSYHDYYHNQYFYCIIIIL